MSCKPPSNWPLPLATEPFRLVCMRRAEDMYATPIWAVPVVVSGEVTGYNLFTDAAMTIAAVGFSVSDVVPCVGTLPGSTENNPLYIAGNPGGGGGGGEDTIDPNYSYAAMQYDGDGNLTHIERTPTAPGIPAVTQSQSYTYVANQLTAITEWQAVGGP